MFEYHCFGVDWKHATYKCYGLEDRQLIRSERSIAQRSLCSGGGDIRNFNFYEENLQICRLKNQVWDPQTADTQRERSRVEKSGESALRSCELRFLFLSQLAVISGSAMCHRWHGRLPCLAWFEVRRQFFHRRLYGTVNICDWSAAKRALKKCSANPHKNQDSICHVTIEASLCTCHAYTWKTGYKSVAELANDVDSSAVHILERLQC